MTRTPTLAGGVRASRRSRIFDGAAHLEGQENNVVVAGNLLGLVAGSEFQTDVHARTHPRGVFTVTPGDRNVNTASVEMLGIRGKRGRELGAHSSSALNSALFLVGLC